MEKLRIGIVGVGHLGKIHIKCIQELVQVYQLVGFYDSDIEQSKKVNKEFAIEAFPTLESLIENVDVVDIVTPTNNHYATAAAAMRKLKHVFIEKPLTNTIEEAHSLIKLKNEAEVKVQIGHVERFNPAFLAAKQYFDAPKFIEVHRLAPFNSRGTDVSVVLDLMIHDIDIVLAVTGANVRKVNASGVCVLSDTPDIANARLEMDNGCVVNLTASRISMKEMRKCRFFQKDAYIAVDFLAKESEIVRLRKVIGEPDPFSVTIPFGEGKGLKEMQFEKPKVEPTNAIRDELAALAESILCNKPIVVSLEDGTRALDVAFRILDKMNQHILLQED